METEKNDLISENIIEAEEVDETFYNKRIEELGKLGIVRHSWSIVDIYNRIKKNTILFEPDYQRDFTWKTDKIVPFIESLFMGIQVPPVYLSENKQASSTDEVSYEVVDGKQRLTTIFRFLNNEITLDRRYLEYFRYILGGKNKVTIEEENKQLLDDMLSGVIDVYVIKGTSPSYSKYDIFSRLNKGVAPLRIGELRRAIYKSHVTTYFDIKTEEVSKKDTSLIGFKAKYKKNNEKIVNRLYRSLTFYINFDSTNKVIKSFNSRLGDLINNTLHLYQTGELQIKEEKLEKIVNFTDALCQLDKIFDEKVRNSTEYIIDTFIPFLDNLEISEIKDIVVNLLQEPEFIETFDKSPGTTNNVNKRIQLLSNLISKYAK